MKVKTAAIVIAGTIAVLAGFSFARIESVQKRLPALVPVPGKIERDRGVFVLGPTTTIVTDTESKPSADYFAQRLRTSTGYALSIQRPTSTSPQNREILLTSQAADQSLGAEGYQLTVKPGGIVIRAPSAPGLFYGVQSLLQLLPPAVLSDKPVQHAAWTIPCVDIEDKPRFAWRGFMLDVSRHFFNKEEIKLVLDLMAFHKLNTFHWHLTDDQGWRIQIKKYPRLTELGAWRRSIGFGLDPKSSTAYGPDTRYGGYYSQADVREIVAYAQSRHITIVPEIEMPGHSGAVLSAYPEFACPIPEIQSSQRKPDVFCGGNDATFNFLEDILTEICALFPGKYIHVGGDEVSKRTWRECPLCQARVTHEGLHGADDLQNYFVTRIAKFLESKGRSLVGWSEISQGQLPSNAMVMDWLGGATEVADGGHDVVRCPNTHCYFDYYQSRDRTGEPPASGAYLPLEQVYAFEPVPKDLAEQSQRHILGPQANLWTEYVPSLKQAEYMTFPRLCALAEVAWSRPEKRRWNDFMQRLETHCKRLEQLGVNYRKLQ